VGARGLGVVGTLVLTRFVAPDAYGDVSGASALVLSANQLSTLGLGQYMIARPDSGRGAVFQAAVVYLLIGVVAIGAMVAFRHPLGPVFGAPQLAMYVPGLALAALFERIGFVPERLLARDMRFSVIGIERTVGEIAYTGASVGLAIAGWGGYAIVLGNIARSFTSMAIVLAAVPAREWLSPVRLEWRALREMLAFGAPLSVGASAAFASRRWDNLLVSRYFGPAVMGLYNLAYNLADIPATHVGEHFGDVLLPSFVQMEAAKRKPALVRAVGLLALVMFPLALGLGLVAPTLAAAFFNRRWVGLAPMLSILAGLSLVRPVGYVVSAYLQSFARTRVIMLLEVGKLVLLLALIATVGRHDPHVACWMVGATFGAHALFSLWLVGAGGEPGFGRILLRVAPALVACVPMAAVVYGVRFGVPLGSHPMLQLLVEVAAGAAAYVASAFVVAREPSVELMRLLRKMLPWRGTVAAKTD
jgi:PST family polysaccharide transporter